MIASIHQPNFMPWLGYFHKIACSDVFVIIDQVQFVKGTICNRNKIKNKSGESVWITVPIDFSKGSFKNFNETEIDHHKPWREKMILQLDENYSDAPFYEPYISDIKKLIEQEFANISELNIELVKYFCKKLSIETRVEIASGFATELGNSNEMLLNICKRFSADVYLSGRGAAKYNNEEMFKQAGVKLIYQEFVSPRYEQINGEFVPNLSVVDLLFNTGPYAKGLFGETVRNFVSSLK